MERFFDRLERWLGPVLAALLAFITIGVFIQVVLRYVFAMSFLWGEEMSLFAFIWCIFLGTAICSVRHSHFSFDMFHGLRGRAAGVQRHHAFRADDRDPPERSPDDDCLPHGYPAGLPPDRDR